MNIAYIDGQNLYMATARSSDPWHIDMKRFRVYLSNKYDVEEAYYFIGAFDEKRVDLYESLQNAGFTLMFRRHGTGLKSDKKGNIDVDLTFYAMRDLRDRGNDYDRALIVSGDGDYFRMVEYLIRQNKFAAMLHPCRRYASSLYKQVGDRYRAFLDNPAIKAKICTRA